MQGFSSEMQRPNLHKQYSGKFQEFPTNQLNIAAFGHFPLTLSAASLKQNFFPIQLITSQLLVDNERNAAAQCD